MMADHEPESGFNLPAGCTDADIERAFGVDDRVCGWCIYYCEEVCDYGFCELEAGDIPRDGGIPGLVRWLDDARKDAQCDTCASWKGYDDE